MFHFRILRRNFIAWASAWRHELQNLSAHFGHIGSAEFLPNLPCQGFRCLMTQCKQLSPISDYAGPSRHRQILRCRNKLVRELGGDLATCFFRMRVSSLTKSLVAVSVVLSVLQYYNSLMHEKLLFSSVSLGVSVRSLLLLPPRVIR